MALLGQQPIAASSIQPTRHPLAVEESISQLSATLHGLRDAVTSLEVAVGPIANFGKADEAAATERSQLANPACESLLLATEIVAGLRDRISEIERALYRT